MFNLKEKWYTRGVLVCGTDKEAQIARDIVRDHEAKELGYKSIIKKLMIKVMVSPVEKAMAHTIICFEAKNLTVAKNILKEFIHETKGIYSCINPICF